ncbi:hypothetical protein L6164_034147 [Bauhinia variegata]|uniref:Uncharacterized protein n=1 Tax=Bauhinia variegata TaxID=167791 RepID=A0ACB9KUB3_BAUVA|nr:hypothetical protein L6164_034147 [Bauhinia variegata]
MVVLMFGYIWLWRKKETMLRRKSLADDDGAYIFSQILSSVNQLVSKRGDERRKGCSKEKRRGDEGDEGGGMRPFRREKQAGVLRRKRDQQVVEDGLRRGVSGRYSRCTSTKWLGAASRPLSNHGAGRGSCPSLMELCIYKIREVLDRGENGRTYDGDDRASSLLELSNFLIYFSIVQV